MVKITCTFTDNVWKQPTDRLTEPTNWCSVFFFFFFFHTALTRSLHTYNGMINERLRIGTSWGQLHVDNVIFLLVFPLLPRPTTAKFIEPTGYYEFFATLTLPVYCCYYHYCCSLSHRCYPKSHAINLGDNKKTLFSISSPWKVDWHCHADV